jgi:hypothetical protein
MVDSYLKDDGTPMTSADFDYTSLQAVVRGRDPRLAHTMFVDDDKHGVWSLASPPRRFVAPFFDGWDADESCATGYAVYKGHNYRYATNNYSEVHNALIYFRYYANVEKLTNGLQFNVNRDYLYPLPTTQVEVLNPNLGQNPGW